MKNVQKSHYEVLGIEEGVYTKEEVLEAFIKRKAIINNDKESTDAMKNNHMNQLIDVYIATQETGITKEYLDIILAKKSDTTRLNKAKEMLSSFGSRVKSFSLGKIAKLGSSIKLKFSNTPVIDNNKETSVASFYRKK